MNNFQSKGDTLTLVAPYDVVSGAGFQVGGIFAVAVASALSGAAIVGMRVGEHELVKAGSQAWTAGDPIYWDNSAKVCTNINTNDLFVGFATEAVASGAGDTLGKVVLVPNLSAVLQGVTGVGAGYKIARGSATALDGSNPTPIATGLTTIVSASVQLRGTAAPGDNTSVLTTDYTGSDDTLNVYAWKNTSGSDPTLVASTGTETFDWIAIGT
jgi:predicted RecA/RadA family phage recombinase